MAVWKYSVKFPEKKTIHKISTMGHSELCNDVSSHPALPCMEGESSFCSHCVRYLSISYLDVVPFIKLSWNHNAYIQITFCLFNNDPKAQNSDSGNSYITKKKKALNSIIGMYT